MNVRLMARTYGPRTISAMSHSSDVATTLENLYTTIRRAATGSPEDLIVALDAVAKRRQSPTPIAVAARRGTSAN